MKCIPTVKAPLGVVMVAVALMTGPSQAGIEVIRPTTDDETEHGNIPEKNCHMIQHGNLSIYGATGRLVVARPIHACTQLRVVPRPRRNDPHTWFVLVRHSPEDCSVERQIVNAHRAGFSGVILYENEDDWRATSHLRPVAPSSHRQETERVYVQFVSGMHGRQLRKHTYEKGFLIRWTHPGKRARIASMCACVGIAGVVLMASLRVMYRATTNNQANEVHRAAAATDRQRADAGGHGRLDRPAQQQAAAERIAALNLPQPEVFLRQLRSFRWINFGHVVRAAARNMPHDDADDETCCVCLEDFGEGVRVRELQCEHHFHLACIDQWLLESKLHCPLCRQPVVFETDLMPDVETQAAAMWMNAVTEASGGDYSLRQLVHYARGLLLAAVNGVEHEVAIRRMIVGGVNDGGVD